MAVKKFYIQVSPTNTSSHIVRETHIVNARITWGRDELTAPPRNPTLSATLKIDTAAEVKKIQGSINRRVIVNNGNTIFYGVMDTISVSRKPEQDYYLVDLSATSSVRFTELSKTYVDVDGSRDMTIQRYLTAIYDGFGKSKIDVPELVDQVDVATMPTSRARETRISGIEAIEALVGWIGTYPIWSPNYKSVRPSTRVLEPQGFTQTTVDASKIGGRWSLKLTERNELDILRIEVEGKYPSVKRTQLKAMPEAGARGLNYNSPNSLFKFAAPRDVAGKSNLELFKFGYLVKFQRTAPRSLTFHSDRINEPWLFEPVEQNRGVVIKNDPLADVMNAEGVAWVPIGGTLSYSSKRVVHDVRAIRVG